MANRRESLFPLMKSSWDAAFRALERSPNPNAVQFVSKAAVHGVPHNFRKVDTNTIVPTYQKSGVHDSFRIRDLGVVYAVAMTREECDLFFPQSANSPVVSDWSSGTAPSDHSSRGDNGLSPTEKTIDGAALLFAGYKGLQALDSAFGSQSTKDEAGFSQLARAANRLNQKQYKIFISHSWTYDEHYKRIVDFLNEVPSLDWQNHSVPSTDPLPATTEKDLKQELRRQIQPASVVIISAGMYGAYSKWINIELDLAEALDKPVIAIVPEGQERVPAKIQEGCTVQVGWRQAPLIDALAEHG